MNGEKKFFFRGLDCIDEKELFAAAGSPRADVRLKAVLYMMKMPKNSFNLILPRLLNDCNPWVRHGARRLYSLVQINAKKKTAEYKLAEKRDTELKDESSIYKVSVLHNYLISEKKQLFRPKTS